MKGILYLQSFLIVIITICEFFYKLIVLSYTGFCKGEIEGKGESIVRTKRTIRFFYGTDKRAYGRLV